MVTEIKGIPPSQLEKFDNMGIDEVASNLSAGIFAGRQARHAETYLAYHQRQSDEKARKQDMSLSKQQLKEAALSNRIAREANKLSAEANRIAKSARTQSWISIGVAILALAVAFVALFWT